MGAADKARMVTAISMVGTGTRKAMASMEVQTPVPFSPAASRI